MQRTPFVKICGLSTPESVDRAVQHGADAVGFVFANSVRNVSAQRANALIARVPAHIETVGVFRSQPIGEVLATATAAGVTTIQFHGYEPYEDVQRAQAEGFRTLRAFAIDEYTELSAAQRAQWDVERLLIDAVEPGGGTPFQPDQLAAAPPSGWWLLAGGLTPDNVASLITLLRPDGVDVSTGVEQSPGVKSLERIESFIVAAKDSPGPAPR